MTAPASLPPKKPLTYEQALVAASALQAASGGDAATVGVVGGLADQVIALRDRVTAWAFGTISRLWAPVNPYDGAAVQQFTAAARDVMVTAQSTVAAAAGANQTQALTTMGVRTPVAPSDPLDVRRFDVGDGGRLVARPDKQTVDYSDGDRQVINLDEDATTQGIFNRPARTYRYLQSQGVDVEQSRAQALDRLGRLVEDNLMLAQRLAETEVLAGAAGVDSSIIGLRRIIHPELSRTGTCGLCIAAVDQVYKVRTLLPIHARCKCTTAAVLLDFDPADTLNKADLSAIYKAAGGTSGPQLKRVRIQIDEHGELGPVLAPAAKFKPRKDFQAPYQRRSRQMARAASKYVI